MNDNLIYVNGLAVSGDYDVQPQTVEHIATIAHGYKLDQNGSEMQDVKAKLAAKDFPVESELDPNDLSDTGWGVIFASADDQVEAVREALQPLLNLRRTQVDNDAYYKEFLGPLGYRSGESKSDFLARHGAGPGPVHPKRGVPYYLLIVGDPESIPYHFQYQCDVQFAIGRICFGEYRNGKFVHNLAAYDQYARSVVAVETGQCVLPRNMTFFGVRNPDDPATNLSAEHLITPLLQNTQEFQLKEVVKAQIRRSLSPLELIKQSSKLNRMAEKQLAEMSDAERAVLANDPLWWTINSYQAEKATKDQLSHILRSNERPTLLFTASHGMVFPKDHKNQLRHQGALVCQDWPGPREWRKMKLKEVPPDYYFSADDIGSDARLLGMIGCMFACYGAGTPKMDEFSKQACLPRSEIAPYAFLSQLPTRMLTQGALAMIGHVERAWGYSFVWDGAGSQTGAFDSLIRSLMEGERVGYTVENLNIRYAELASDLNSTLEEIEHGTQVNPVKVAGMWTATNDAGGYIIIGDPAVRLQLADETTSATEHTISPSIYTEKGTTQEPTTPSPSFAADAQVQGTLPEKVTTKPAAAESFALVDDVKRVTDELGSTIQKLVRNMGKALDDIATLNVKTFVADLDEEDPDNAIRLCAETNVSFDGDIDTTIPRQDGQIEHELWQIHREMVDLAQKHRTSMIEMLLSLGVEVLKIK